MPGATAGPSVMMGPEIGCGKMNWFFVTYRTESFVTTVCRARYFTPSLVVKTVVCLPPSRSDTKLKWSMMLVPGASYSTPA